MSTAASEKTWPTIFNAETCVRKGECPVTVIRDQSEPLESHTLYFEQHGTGPEKIVFIMGLNTTSFAYSHQVGYFAQTGKHSALVFDNRGVGNSSTPRGPYTTSGMAEDVLVLLKYIGWTEDVHVVGISLGGMIAQELATRIPERIVSLSLCVTKPGGFSLASQTPWKGFSGIFKGLFYSDIEKKITNALTLLFPQAWLDLPSSKDPSKTNRDVERALLIRRAQLARPQTLAASLSQISAATTHKVTEDRHRLIAAKIPKILVITGDQDILVHPANSKELVRRMPEAELVEWKDTAHCVHLQWPERFNHLIERVVEEGRKRFEERKRTQNDN